MANTRQNVECRHIVITNNSCNESTNVTQEITSIVDVNTIGPQGPIGPQGIQGVPGSLTSASSLNIIGSVTASGNISGSGHLVISGITSSGHLIPSADSTYNLGEDNPEKRWASIYADGIAVSTTTTGNIRLQGDLSILNRAQTSYIPFSTRDITGDETVMNLSNIGTLSANSTGSFEHLKLDYDKIPSSNPNIKGVIYRNGSNQLFISEG